MLPEIEVRRATWDDAARLAQVLARAFADDPVMAWSCPRDERRPDFGTAFFGERLGRCLPDDLVWTTPGLEGAALWSTPDHWRAGLRGALRLLPAVAAARALGRLPLVLRGMGTVEARHPTDPHLYLAVLGTEPALQGRGIGGALLAPGLELCDREGIPAYLESSKERNVPFYERFGFRVTGTVELPRGPRVRLMLREPR